jgi:hypothetical protein
MLDEEAGWKLAQPDMSGECRRRSQLGQERRYRPRPPTRPVLHRQRPYRCIAANWRLGPKAVICFLAV